MHEKKNSRKPLIVYYIISLVVVMLLNTLLFPQIERYSVKEVAYSEFLEMLVEGKIKSVQIEDKEIAFTPVEQLEDGKATYYTTNRVTADDQIVERLLDADVTFGQVVPEEMSPIIEFLLSWVLPLVVFYALGSLMFRRMTKSMGGNSMSFGKSNAKIYVEAQTGKTFDDVAGADEAKDALQEIERALSRRKQREVHWAAVRELYQCCAGITGGSVRGKMTFEAYVQQVYFKQVVAAANKRLTVLTDGQFILRCREEARDMKHQSGLDLEVLDRATGQWRDVSTLSGGESFLASLALALGLSDVVQAQSGAIRMDAMFIDEGFGTLDENALMNSLRVLTDLAGGSRLIGIISHVHDLEERIEKQIIVKKTLTGSEIRMVV